jgi:DNA polymerase III delta prime subunit
MQILEASETGTLGAEAFRDHMEHLEALVGEAAALAWMRFPKRRNPYDDEAREAPVLSYGETRSVNEAREEASIRAGVALPFVEICARHRLSETERRILLLFLYGALMDAGLAADREQNVTDLRNGVSPSAIAYRLAEGIEERLGILRLLNRESKLVSTGLLRPEIGDEEDRAAPRQFTLSPWCLSRILDEQKLGLPRTDFVRLEEPQASLDDVVLPDCLKNRIVDTVRRFSATAGDSGLVLLFSGVSGTGKTMMAHALARMLGKPLVFLPMNCHESKAVRPWDVLRRAFAEASLVDGVLLIDEFDILITESFPVKRTMLVELERFKGICVLAANRPLTLPVAFDRRIQLKVEFPAPGLAERLEIWHRALPDGFRYGADVDLERICREYVFTGGTIKNAALLARGLSAQGEGSLREISMADLSEACEVQADNLRQFIRLGRVKRPSVTLDDLVPVGGRKNLEAFARSVGEMEKGTPEIHHFWCEDAGTGLEAIEAVAGTAGCDLRVFPFREIRDAITARNWGGDDIFSDPLEYMFSKWVGRKAVTVIVEGTDSAFSSDEESSALCEMLPDIFLTLQKKENYGPVVVLSVRPLPERALQYVGISRELSHPTGQEQAAAWAKGLAGLAIPGYFSRDLAASHTMHVREIERLCRRFLLFNPDAGGMSPEKVFRKLADFIEPSKTPVPMLFGRKA